MGVGVQARTIKNRLCAPRGGCRRRGAPLRPSGSWTLQQLAQYWFATLKGWAHFIHQKKFLNGMGHGSRAHHGPQRTPWATVRALTTAHFPQDRTTSPRPPCPARGVRVSGKPAPPGSGSATTRQRQTAYPFYGGSRRLSPRHPPICPPGGSPFHMRSKAHVLPPAPSGLLISFRR